MLMLMLVVRYVDSTISTPEVCCESWDLIFDIDQVRCHSQNVDFVTDAPCDTLKASGTAGCNRYCSNTTIPIGCTCDALDGPIQDLFCPFGSQCQNPRHGYTCKGIYIFPQPLYLYLQLPTLLSYLCYCFVVMVLNSASRSFIYSRYHYNK
jgi:hypothetical protein